MCGTAATVNTATPRPPAGFPLLESDGQTVSSFCVSALTPALNWKVLCSSQKILKKAFLKYISHLHSKYAVFSPWYQINIASSFFKSLNQNRPSRDKNLKSLKMYTRSFSVPLSQFFLFLAFLKYKEQNKSQPDFYFTSSKMQLEKLHPLQQVSL